MAANEQIPEAVWLDELDIPNTVRNQVVLDQLGIPVEKAEMNVVIGGKPTTMLRIPGVALVFDNEGYAHDAVLSAMGHSSSPQQ